ncbi:hypothetical protein PHMEG_00024400 [Phytophthora megakarya]|uniref:Uncharacterized protein n=1 Tax=Phytophthora megakarya TaxID=4795 RepID=A0A225VDS7_9STRA|nr:hypothetical protein PHMEG_00024400 [Phytophthora megakarya]
MESMTGAMHVRNHHPQPVDEVFNLTIRMLTTTSKDTECVSRRTCQHGTNARSRVGVGSWNWRQCMDTESLDR